MTVVNTHPLLAERPHEWQTLITVIKRVQNINAIVVVPEKKTAISLDMELYEKAKQLEMANPDFQGKWVLRRGELYIVTAALRIVGASIDRRYWHRRSVDSFRYHGPVTTRQIFLGKHMKGSLTVHLITLQALFQLYLAEFSNHWSLETQCLEYHTRNAIDCRVSSLVSSLDNIKGHMKNLTFFGQRTTLWNP